MTGYPEIPLRGLLETAIDSNELPAEIRIPGWPKGARIAHRALGRTNDIKPVPTLSGV